MPTVTVNLPDTTFVSSINAEGCSVINNTFSGIPIAPVAAIETVSPSAPNVFSTIYGFSLGIGVSIGSHVIQNNNIYDSNMGIRVSTPSAQITGNSWRGGVANMYDIVLDASVAGSYDQAALSARNNAAHIGIQ